MPLAKAIQKIKSLFVTEPKQSGRSRRTNFLKGFGAQSGGFEGGRINRLTEEFNPGTIGPNRVFEQGGRRLRERARDLVLNNPLAASAVESIVSNVIECGFVPKPQFDDREQRKLWTRGWNRWGGLTPLATRECDVAGESTINELAALWLEEVVVGGGCLTHYIEAPRRGRSIPLALELIPEERFAEHVQYFGSNPKTRNRVINGMEVEESSGRTIAYHVTNHLPNDMHFDPERSIRLPADQCEYYFFKHRVGQKRGYTLMHAVIVWLWALGYYTDNELYASDIKSSWAYMILTDKDSFEGFDWADLMDSDPETGATDIYGNVIEKHEPGQIWRGVPGDKIEAVGPNVPTSECMPWIMMMQRLIAIGFSLSYEEVVRDYSKGSFSSVRAASNSDRKRFRRMQKCGAVPHFYNPTWGRFAQHGARAGLDGFPRSSEFTANIDEWVDVSWGLPGWVSVNPREDSNADDTKLKNRSTTLKAIVERDGGDIDEHFDQLDREKQMAEERGMTWPPGQTVASSEPEPEESSAKE